MVTIEIHSITIKDDEMTVTATVDARRRIDRVFYPPVPGWWSFCLLIAIHFGGAPMSGPEAGKKT